MSIPTAVAAVRAELAQAAERAGRDPASVHLIAVTKAQGPEVLPILAACGVTTFGENRIDHLAVMAAAAPAAAFHHIGRLQSRQIPTIVAHAVAVHGLCEIDHALRLERAAAAADRRLTVFCQVNTSGEPSKAGIVPEALGDLLAAARSGAHLDVVGLMTMAPEMGTQADMIAVRTCFRRLRSLAEQHGLARLSMGMSGDAVIAVEEGATDVRIGTRLFA